METLYDAPQTSKAFGSMEKIRMLPPCEHVHEMCNVAPEKAFTLKRVTFAIHDLNVVAPLHSNVQYARPAPGAMPNHGNDER